MERDPLCAICSSQKKNFNSHAHVERDMGRFNTDRLESISTHTLTWSVTNQKCFFAPQNSISTHTLTWSVTINAQKDGRTGKFQLTRSRGAWRPLSPYFSLYIYFNSHAHVERDVSCHPDYQYQSDFNSHAHVERDELKNLLPDLEKISTHTLTWSVTIGYFFLIITDGYFNSHAHVERDGITHEQF